MTPNLPPCVWPASWPDFVAPASGLPVPRIIFEIRAAELVTERQPRPVTLPLRPMAVRLS